MRLELTASLREITDAAYTEGLWQTCHRDADCMRWQDEQDSTVDHNDWLDSLPDNGASIKREVMMAVVQEIMEQTLDAIDGTVQDAIEVESFTSSNAFCAWEDPHVYLDENFAVTVGNT